MSISFPYSDGSTSSFDSSGSYNGSSSDSSSGSNSGSSVTDCESKRYKSKHKGKKIKSLQELPEDCCCYAVKDPKYAKQVNKDGHTNLMDYASVGKYEKVKKLIELGADVNARDKDGKSVYYHALRSNICNESKSAKLVRQNGAKVCIAELVSWGVRFGGYLFKFDGCIGHHTNDTYNRILKYILKHLGSFDWKSGKSAYKFVIKLLNEMYYIEDKLVFSLFKTLNNNSFQSKKSLECLDLVTNMGFDVNTEDTKGETLLFYLVRHGCDKHFAKYMIGLGADVNIVNDDGLKLLVAVQLTDRFLKNNDRSVYDVINFKSRQELDDADKLLIKNEIKKRNRPIVHHHNHHTHYNSGGGGWDGDDDCTIM